MLYGKQFKKEQRLIKKFNIKSNQLEEAEFNFREVLNKFPKLKNLKNIRIYKPVIRKNIKGKRISIFRAKVDIPSVITYADRVIIVIVITQWGVWGITIVVTNPFILVCIRQSSKIEYNK